MNDAAGPEVLAAELRARAMARLEAGEGAARPVGLDSPSAPDGQALLHELRVHQVELEMQNEELLRRQLELEISRQRWFELYDLAPIAYCTVSESGLILQVNLATAELLRQPRAALAQRRLSEFIQPEDQPGYYALHGQLLSSPEPKSLELRLLDAHGEERWVQLTATAAAPDMQGERGLRIILQDISARRQADAAEAALRVAEQTQRDRSAFLSRVSHELRTPLNAIVGFSHLLLRNDTLTQPPAARRQLQHILDAGMHLVQMVTDLLDVSCAESGQLSLQLGRVDVCAVLKDALRDVAGQAHAAGITFDADVNGVIAAAVRADPTRLRQVLQNLLTNAVKYNQAGGRVSAGLERRGEHWRIRIADNGLGMSTQQLANLFQPFNRLGRERAGIEGTGLGLVIARELVQAMGGQMGVHSSPGQGSMFWVELVALDGAQAQRTGMPDAQGLRVRTDVSGRLLCVENDRASQDLISHTLDGRPGLEREIVGSGAACLAAARRQWPSLLLLDLHLPDMHGLDVLRVLRQINPHLPLRCLVVSADCAPDEVSECRAAGANAYLAKPINPVELLSVIDRLLDADTDQGRAPDGRQGPANSKPD